MSLHSHECMVRENEQKNVVELKTFYLCRLCLIVFGALLAGQSVFAKDHLDRPFTDLRTKAFFDFMTPSSQEMKPPENPGRFRCYPSE